MQTAPGYEIVGQGTETMIFLPALGTTREMWNPQVRYFERYYRVVSYDAGGHHAARTLGRSLSDIADELDTLSASIGAQRPHIVGISMGGMIAQELAIRHPDMPASLVLVNTTSSYEPEARQQIELRAETAETEGMSSLVDPTLERWFTSGFRDRDPGSVNVIREMLRTADPVAYAEAARAVAAVDTGSELGQIRCPTLVVRSELDASMPATAAQALRRDIPNSRLALISDSAHLCSVELPEEFNRLVFQFLGTLAPR